MGVQIGLVGQRADLAVDVAALAARAGGSLVSLGPADLSAAGGPAPGLQVDMVLVDALVLHAASPVGTGSVLRGRGVGAGEPGPPVVVICRSGEVGWAREGAAAVGCDHVVELPLGAPWLVSQLAPEGTSSVLAVMGAVGGVGTTTVAIACAVGAGADCLLVDADPDSPGLDLPLGIPEGTGVRWPDIPDTSEPLDPGSLRSALPEVGGVWVVTGSHVGSDRVAVRGRGCAASGAMAGVVGVGRAEFARTVLDAGRGTAGGLTGAGDALALVLPATLAGVVAGRRALDAAGAQQVVVLLRATGWLPADEVAEQLGVPIALEVPRLRRAAELADCGDLLSGRTGRALRTLGEQVWGHLA